MTKWALPEGRKPLTAEDMTALTHRLADTAIEQSELYQAAKRDAEEAEAYAAELEKERDHWKDVAGREGVCMACRGPRGAFDPYGCTDCLNTGYCGEHHSTVAELEAKLAKAVDGLRQCEAEIDDYIRHEYPGDHPVQARYRKRDFDANPARATLAGLTGGKDE